jgi:putative transcriptional regulator
MSGKSSSPKMVRDGIAKRLRRGRKKSSGQSARKSAADILAAARTDPDNPPLTTRTLSRMKRLPRVRTLRRALDLTQEEFARVYRIPLGTLRDWEQRRTRPDQAACAYLTIIARDPEHTRRVLASGAP